MWLHHLVNLLFRAAGNVPAALGSTWLGIFFPGWMFIVAGFVTGYFNGWQTVTVWLKNVGVGLAVAMIAWGGLFVCCLLGAVYRDHMYFVEKAGGFHAQVGIMRGESAKELEAVKDNMNGKLADLRTNCALVQGKAETLDRQNRDQQGTINNCQSQALKLLAPEPLKITPLRLEEELPSPQMKARKSKFLLLTNKSISPVRMAMRCDRVFQIGMFGGSIIGGGGTQAGGSQMVSPKTAEIAISMPSWTPISPLLIEISYVSTSDADCSFDEQ